MVEPRPERDLLAPPQHLALERRGVPRLARSGVSRLPVGAGSGAVRELAKKAVRSRKGFDPIRGWARLHERLSEVPVHLPALKKLEAPPSPQGTAPTPPSPSTTAPPSRAPPQMPPSSTSRVPGTLLHQTTLTIRGRIRTAHTHHLSNRPPNRRVVAIGVYGAVAAAAIAAVRTDMFRDHPLVGEFY